MNPFLPFNFVKTSRKLLEDANILLNCLCPSMFRSHSSQYCSIN